MKFRWHTLMLFIKFTFAKIIKTPIYIIKTIHDLIFCFVDFRKTVKSLSLYYIFFRLNL